MKEFHFSKTYFNKLFYEDGESGIRVIIKERPSIQITEEEYSLRIETQHEENRLIHRKYAIEHHSNQQKHSRPHLQFKFHTEEIGTFWITLNFKNAEEYRKAVLGFIYKIKGILEDLERYKIGITNEILVLDLVNKLNNEGEFLIQKISESINKKEIEFQSDIIRNKIDNFRSNPLLIKFLGGSNLNKIAEVNKNYKST